MPSRMPDRWLRGFGARAGRADSSFHWLNPIAAYTALMNWKVALTTFGLIFLAEMGDKTQLAAISMVAKTKAPWAVFLGAALALCLVSLLGVMFGEALTRYVPEEVLKKISAVSFLVIGGLMLWGKI